MNVVGVVTVWDQHAHGRPPAQTYRCDPRSPLALDNYTSEGLCNVFESLRYAVPSGAKYGKKQ